MYTSKRIFNTIIDFFKPSPQAWVGASLGVFLVTIVIWATTSLKLFKEEHLEITSFYFFGGILLAIIFFGLFLLIITLLMRLPTLYKWAVGCCLILLNYAFLPFSEVNRLIFLYLAIIIFTSLLGGALVSFFSKQSRASWVMTLLLFLIGLTGISFLAVWLIYDPFSFNAPLVALGSKQAEQIDLSNPSTHGPYVVEQLFYGSGKDLHRPEYGKDATIITQSVDGSSFLQGWKGIDGWLRTKYWGFDDTQLPLNGRVWYPKGDGPFPLVLIVHGNHEMREFSDPGYQYLGKLFASHGFIAASIDENFLNDTWLEWGDLVEGEARGWLLLEHLTLWREWNQTPGNPLFKKVDMKNIALIGHSRGGEAITIAAALNPLQYYPGDANIRFDYDFNIVSLAAIAPVDGRYMLGGLKIHLNDINYFVLHGSHDGDVRSFMGTAQYQRVKFTEKEPYHFKAALYVFGANHGQFNETWGLSDVSWPSSAIYALGKIMPEQEQQMIAEVYLTAYLQATLKDKTGYIPLFRNYSTGKEWLPQTLYLNQFEDSSSEYVILGKDGIDITKTGLPGVTLFGKNLDVWKQRAIRLKQGIFLGTGIFLGWNSCSIPKQASYTITLPENEFEIDENNVLFISLAATDGQNEMEFEKPCVTDVPIDFSIELIDNENQAATLPLSDFGYLQPPVKAEILKSAFFDNVGDSELIFQTFQFPLKDFVAVNAQFNPRELKIIRFIFDRTPNGLMVMDKLGFNCCFKQRIKEN